MARRVDRGDDLLTAVVAALREFLNFAPNEA